MKIELVDPTDEQLETIRLGRFRIYNVDIKRDIIFESKQMLFNICLLLKLYRLIEAEKNNI